MEKDYKYYFENVLNNPTIKNFDRKYGNQYMRFSKYKGYKIVDIVKYDNKYCDYLLNQNYIQQDLKNMIIEIQKEYKNIHNIINSNKILKHYIKNLYKNKDKEFYKNYKLEYGF